MEEEGSKARTKAKRELRAGSVERGAGSVELGAGRRERGAGSGEAEGRERWGEARRTLSGVGYDSPLSSNQHSACNPL